MFVGLTFSRARSRLFLLASGMDVKTSESQKKVKKEINRNFSTMSNKHDTASCHYHSDVHAIPVLDEAVATDDDNYLLGRTPVVMPICPKCNSSNARTMTKTYPSLVTWGLVVVGGFVFWPLCWVPLVMDPVSSSKASLLDYENFVVRS